MTHIRSAAAAFFGVLLCCLPVVAEDAKPVLRSQVVTLSDVVTIGDFYSNAGALAAKPLFRSPDMGTSGDVAATLVAERARSAGLKAAGTDGLRQVSVHRGAATFDRGQLAQLIRKALAERNASVDISMVDVRFFQAPDKVLADPKVAEPLRIERIDWSPTTGHFTTVGMVATENGYQPLTMTGLAVEMVDILALAQPLRRGDILKEGDLSTIRMPRTKVTTGAVVDADEIIGKEARSNIRANSPLARKDFQRPVLVKRGDKVTVTYLMTGMKLTSRAQAMDDGAKGDVIDVMNLTSRRIVPAIISSRGQVRVHAANPVIASLNSETD
ncbi:flagellar basal body P-ring formation protein FlgA [Roseibium denhamense]|uniref:Flagella basal body P-ring formation protein FlgA n=1 Tax=Roseibium denhamense TaxID=76305 RepID=A0ABY1N8Y1_9HYPH|nr:flagellar basal body P-ring formation chaperone FlgA [Roseibium denhamense]MTI05942.1 flagellar basal body P-ring formation protein FlgA [Roseibium denhamense]SMP02947.1 flagella basal body P-ring formation protein FlgA [Roseibium denhamense]